MTIFCSLVLSLDVIFASLGFSTGNELFAFFGIGLFFAQVVVLAVCTVLFPFHTITKLLIGTLSIGVLGILLAIFMRYARSPVPMLMVVIVFVQWGIYMVPLAGCRLSGWTIDWQHKQEGSESESETETETQFGLNKCLFGRRWWRSYLRSGNSPRRPPLTKKNSVVWISSCSRISRWAIRYWCCQ